MICDPYAEMKSKNLIDIGSGKSDIYLYGVVSWFIGSAF